MAPKAAGDSAKVNSLVYKDKSKPTDIRLSNINAAKGMKHLIFISEIRSVFTSKYDLQCDYFTQYV